VKRIDVDAAWLADQYLEQRASLAQIAARAGVSERTVRNKLRASGIGRRAPRPAPPREPAPVSRYPALNDPHELARRMSEGASILGLANEIGCDRSAVRVALVRHGIDWDRSRTRSS
jgi:hypothetical protein